MRINVSSTHFPVLKMQRLTETSKILVSYCTFWMPVARKYDMVIIKWFHCYAVHRIYKLSVCPFIHIYNQKCNTTNKILGLFLIFLANQSQLVK